MKENKIPSAEEYLKNSETYEEEYSNISLHDAKQRMIEFAKLHVNEIQKLQQAKYYAGETGYIKKEEWGELLNKIK